jgi:hypothetical protein
MNDVAPQLQELTSIDAVRRLEDEMLALPQVQLATQLLVHGQMAARTIFIPAGTILTGALTKSDNICLASGDITVTTDEGPKRLTGFHVLPAKAGAKRAGIAHADTWWTTVHHTALTDPAEIENEMSDEAAMLQTRRLLKGNQP